MTDPLFLSMAFDVSLTDPKRLLALLDDMGSAGLNLSRLDDVEPARKVYSEATITDLLTIPPVSKELPCRNLLGRGDRSHVGIRACIPREPGRGSANIVDVTMNRPRKQDMGLLAGFFEGEFFARHGVAYACLDTWPEFARQHVAGTINDRLPGVFWLNWLSGRYVEAIGEDVILSLPWFRTTHRAGGLICRLYEDLGSVPDDRAALVDQFETDLGREKFVKGGWVTLPQLAVSTE